MIAGLVEIRLRSFIGCTPRKDMGFYRGIYGTITDRVLF